MSSEIWSRLVCERDICGYPSAGGVSIQQIITDVSEENARVLGVLLTSGLTMNFVRGGGSTNSVEDRGQREWGSGGGSPVVRGSGGSCNLVQDE